MPAQRTFRHHALSAVLIAVALTACGGSPGGGGSTPPPAAPPTTLTISAASLSLAVSGNPRLFTIANTGTQTAQMVSVSTGAALPVGTTSISTCNNLPAGATCTVTVTPGATPSATPGNTSPVPASLNIAGSNTNTLTAQIHVLDHGSVYQGGYVFAIDDTTPNTGGIGGKVASLTDASFGTFWGADAVGGAAITSVPGALSLVDGAANTAAIVAAMGPGSEPHHAAGLCSASTASGHSDWYLPAACDMGPGGGCVIGQGNMHDNLENHGSGNIGNLSGQYWTSTQSSTLNTAAWIHFATSGLQSTGIKSLSLSARCARSLTI
ncbi:MAG: hypothetical protein IBJ14_10040 [Hydrogenophaga sp.]|nr:hypothetical protein [Hydrogenophaga sp.]